MGVLLVSAGLILSAPLPHAVDQRDADQDRGGTYHVAVQSLDHLTLGGGLPQQIVLTQPSRHPVALDTGLGAHLLDRLGEQAEALTQLDVLVGEVAGCRGGGRGC